MLPPFNRRDSICGASAAAALLAAVAASVTRQSGWGWTGSSLAALAAGCVAVVLMALLTGRLPPDVALRPLDATGRRDAMAAAPSDTARLRIALRREPLSLFRLDVFVDGARVGQLRPGTAFVVPLRPGHRVLSARVWLRRLDLNDQINALPGTDSDFVISGSGGRTRSYGIDRHGLPAMLLDPRTVLIEPPEPSATVSAQPACPPRA